MIYDYARFSECVGWLRDLNVIYKKVLVVHERSLNPCLTA